MTATSRLVPVAFLVALGLLTACGADDEPVPVPSTTSAPTTVAPTTTSAPTGTTTSPAPTTMPTGTTPAPAPGGSFEGEGMTPAQANELQDAVDQGHQPWRLDAKLVAEAFVKARFGWSEVDCELADPHTAEVTNRADGRMVVLQLRQPARAGEGGIWAVVSGVWVK